MKFDVAKSRKGDKNLAMTFSDGNEVWATVQDITWETFLGLTDSVKTITFSLKNPSILPEQKIYDSLYYKIGKKYGLLETRLLEIIQENGMLSASVGLLGKKITLIGLEQENVGWKPLADSSIFNFQVGDEFHYNAAFIRDHSQGCGYASSIIKIVLNKQVLNDTATYTLSRKTLRIGNFCLRDTSFIQDTIVESYFLDKKNKEINRMNLINEPVNIDISTSNFYYTKYSEGDSVIYGATIHCPRELTYGSSFKLAKGLGEISYEQSNGLGGYSNQNLVYYKKGNKTMGTPLVLALENNTANLAFQIHIGPNPATEIIQISTPLTAEFKITDLTGQERLSSRSIIPGNNEINIQSLEAGLYLFQIWKDHKILKSGKVVIQ